MNLISLSGLLAFSNPMHKFVVEFVEGLCLQPRSRDALLAVVLLECQTPSSLASCAKPVCSDQSVPLQRKGNVCVQAARGSFL